MFHCIGWVKTISNDRIRSVVFVLDGWGMEYRLFGWYGISGVVYGVYLYHRIV